MFAFPEDEIRDVEGWKVKLASGYNRILDAGCGTGRFIEKIGKEKVIGIDNNKKYIRLCKHKRLKVKRASVTKIPFPNNCFELIFCNHVLEHLLPNEQIKAMKEFHRVLKPSGKLLVFSPTPGYGFWAEYSHIRPHTHYSLWKLAKDTKFKRIKTYFPRLRFLPLFLQKILARLFEKEVGLECYKS